MTASCSENSFVVGQYGEYRNILHNSEVFEVGAFYLLHTVSPVKSNSQLLSYCVL